MANQRAYRKKREKQIKKEEEEEDDSVEKQRAHFKYERLMNICRVT